MRARLCAAEAERDALRRELSQAKSAFAQARAQGADDLAAARAVLSDLVQMQPDLPTLRRARDHVRQRLEELAALLRMSPRPVTPPSELAAALQTLASQLAPPGEVAGMRESALRYVAPGATKEVRKASPRRRPRRRAEPIPEPTPRTTIDLAATLRPDTRPPPCAKYRRCREPGCECGFCDTCGHVAVAHAIPDATPTPSACHCEVFTVGTDYDERPLCADCSGLQRPGQSVRWRAPCGTFTPCTECPCTSCDRCGFYRDAHE
jgi:hypothetical protein